MPQINANGIVLEVERFGPSHGHPIVLIRGYGSQLIDWPPALIDGLIQAGLHVVVFDNRDAGLSQKMTDASAYDLTDMAVDTAALVSELGLNSAHVLGMSLGGMIAQLMALRHPDCLRSASIVMSSSLAKTLPPMSPEIRDALSSSPNSGSKGDVIAHNLKTGRLWQSPDWPFDDTVRAAAIERAYERCYCPEGLSRQFAAMMQAGPDLADIYRIDLPVQVIHGVHDKLLPLEHSRDIARRIPGAEIIAVDGMGHDLEGDLPKIILSQVTRFVRKVERL